MTHCYYVSWLHALQEIIQWSSNKKQKAANTLHYFQTYSQDQVCGCTCESRLLHQYKLASATDENKDSVTFKERTRLTAQLGMGLSVK